MPNESGEPGHAGISDVTEPKGVGALGPTSPEASNASAPAGQPVGLQTKARMLREKYKIPGGKIRLPLRSVGFDIHNRDGIPMSGERCDELLGDIDEAHFDPEEADHDNVCVQARPNSTELHEHNLNACLASPLLADPIGHIEYGTLSHSHLHQCFKNIAGQAKATKPKGIISDDTLSLAMCKERHPKMAEYIEHGLLWEVLSYRVRDDKDACEIIQSAINRKSEIQRPFTCPGHR